MGGVLPDFIGFVAWGATAFPAPLEDWVGSYTGHMISYYGIKAFPAPVEAWVGSDALLRARTKPSFAQFPAPLEVWVVSYRKIQDFEK